MELGMLYEEFKDRSNHPWLVSLPAQGATDLGDGVNGVSPLSLFGFFRGHLDDWCEEVFSGLAKGLSPGLVEDPPNDFSEAQHRTRRLRVGGTAPGTTTQTVRTVLAAVGSPVYAAQR